LKLGALRISDQSNNQKNCKTATGVILSTFWLGVVLEGKTANKKTKQNRL